MNFITSWKFPSATAQDASVGTSAWTFESEIFVDDSAGVGDESALPNIFVAGGGQIRYRKSSLVKAGVVQTANNEAANENASVAFPAPRTYGGASDMWGATLTPDDVNAEDFGVALTLIEFDGSYQDETNYLIAKAFGFEIPDGATIVGIEAKFDAYGYASGGGTTSSGLNYVQMRVHYTWEPVVEAQGIGSGFVYGETAQRKRLQKRYRYKVFEHDGGYLGDWKPKDVASEPSFKREVNNLISTMPVVLTRNELYRPKKVEQLLEEDDDPILTEDDQPILIDVQTGSGLGQGTDTEVNHDVEVDGFYGEFAPILTEDDIPITTEDDQLILAEDGYPHGRPLFTGYINEWELGFGEMDDNIAVQLMSHSQELDDIMLETEDTAVVSYENIAPDDSIGIAGSGPTDRERLGFTFTQVGTVPITGIALKCRSWGSGGSVQVTLTLKVGAPGAGGATLVTAQATIPNGNGTDLTELRFAFPAEVTLTNAVVYGVMLDTDDAKTGGNETYPAQFGYNPSGGYSGGQGYDIISGGSWTARTYDLWFKVYEPGGDTTVTFNSTPPGNIAKRIIDFARSRGWRGNYDVDSIEDTGTVVSITFNSNTCLEALNKIPELCPADWFQTFDPGRNIYSLRERPADPEQFFTRSKNVSRLRVKKSIADLVNQVYFSGGDTGGGDNLFVKVTDTASREDWRPGLLKLSDNRVTVVSTGQILSQAEIDRLKEPLYSGSIILIDQRGFYIEDVMLGLQAGFINFGVLVDGLALQLRSITYDPDTLVIDLNSLPPKLAKRVEDIRRALALLENVNNPSAPS